MTLNSPIFRRFLWCAFSTALVNIVFLALYAGRLGGRAIIAAVCVAFIVALFAAWLGARTLIRRIVRARASAEDLFRADMVALSPSPDAQDELGALARSLRRAAGEWQGLLARLELESARREAILKSMAEGVLAVDDGLRVVFCNESFARLVGARLPIPSRLPLLDLARDPSLTGMLAQVIKTGAPSKQTIQLAAAGSRVFEVHAAPLAEATYTGAIAILHDITDLERLERVRTDFVANVSHELRTPLTAIRGYAETLLDSGVEGETRKFLEIILNHSIRLNNIASDLLILSELESGRSQPEQDAVPAGEIVDSALRAVESEASARQVRLVRGRVEELSLAGSRRRIEQAMINLLSNAVKFNRPGGSVRVDAEHSREGKACITVSDTGVGIPSEDLSRIFERFYRVDKARSSEVGGTGLGLSIVKHAVERMGGHVRVESQLGKGSTFTVTLPRCK